MKSFKNNRRGRFRNNDRGYKRNGGESLKLGHDFSSNSNFRRKTQGRNNFNAAKLIEKYNGLAREALSSGDKILSENYFQHADHFTRILSAQENAISSKVQESKIEVVSDNTKNENLEASKEKKNEQ